MVKRTVVGAHYGLSGWLAQRVSAAVMTLYTLLFVLALAAIAPTDYAAWRAVFASQAMKLATFVFFVSLFVHAWVGMRDVLMDYAKPMSLRLALEVLVVVVLLAWAGWALQILWGV